MTTAIPTSEVVRRACNIAHSLHHQDNVSPWRLLQDSGYVQRRAEIDVASLTQCFVEHPDLIGEWLIYSENKHVSSGWYFSADSTDGRYVVGYFPADAKKQECRFTSAADACAVFVKSELEAMA